MENPNFALAETRPQARVTEGGLCHPPEKFWISRLNLVASGASWRCIKKKYFAQITSLNHHFIDKSARLNDVNFSSHAILKVCNPQ